MNNQIEPADAARALSEIDQRREQVIRRKVFPAWWWWAYAVLITGLAVAVESGGVLPWIGITVFVAVSLAIDVPVRRAARAAAPRRGLAGPGATRKTLIGVASFVVGLLGVGLVTGLSLKAAGVPHPGTIAAVVTAVLFAFGGPLLVRYEQAMLVRRPGSQR